MRTIVRWSALGLLLPVLAYAQPTPADGSHATGMPVALPAPAPAQPSVFESFEAPLEIACKSDGGIWQDQYRPLPHCFTVELQMAKATCDLTSDCTPAKPGGRCVPQTIWWWNSLKGHAECVNLKQFPNSTVYYEHLKTECVKKMRGEWIEHAMVPYCMDGWMKKQKAECDAKSGSWKWDGYRNHYTCYVPRAVRLCKEGGGSWGVFEGSMRHRCKAKGEDALRAACKAKGGTWRIDDFELKPQCL